jgi:phosphatidate cytidylyltransferase
MNCYLLLYFSGSKGLAWVVFVILAAVVTDVAALLVGSRLGRTPFFNRISPRKTVEGAVAGLIAAVLVMVFGSLVTLGLPLIHAVAIGLLIGMGAEIGDLVESQMKRIAEVKDSSNLIPGHGGVLDRFDSILFPPILVYYYALFGGLLH